MKKITMIILACLLCFVLVACNGYNDLNSSATDDTIQFKQEVTIVKMPSPPKCKTSNKIAVVDEILETLALIEKTPYTRINGETNGWEMMIKLSIDGQEITYTIGEVFTDADGSQYYVENLEEIKEKINNIYDKIDAVEVDYP